MNSCLKYFSVSLLALATQAAFAQVPQLGAASDFAVLSVGTSTSTPPPAPDATAAVTTTRSTITGDVGSAGAVSFGDETSPSVITGNVVLTGAYTQVPASPPAYSGMLSSPLSPAAIMDFNAAYAALATVFCDQNLALDTYTDTTLSVNPGVICAPAAVTFTRTTLTLNGGPNDTWLFKIGNTAVGALTGTNFSVVLPAGASACNVTWWVDAAASMTTTTTSDFKGTILAGAGITMTGTAPATPVEGRALARAGVTLTDIAFLGCEGGGGNGNGNGNRKGKCNQGVGNGPENCDPGNSNQDGHNSNPFLGNPRTNDELGGTPGNPGRKGGNKQ